MPKPKEKARPWLCPSGHLLGRVERDDHGYRLIFYEQSLDPQWPVRDRSPIYRGEARERIYNAKHRQEQVDYQRVRHYGITREQYDAMYIAQYGKCAVCGKHVAPLCLDHDHVGGKTRGLLCHKCNRGLGFFCDDPEITMFATRYLKQWRYK